MPFVHRPILMSDRGMVVSGHHRASEAGAEVLRHGGNAVDAAVTAAAVLCAAIPHMNGIGGDCFALYYEAASGSVTAINGSGAAPLQATPTRYREAGHTSIPARGPLSISVCGLVDAWQSALTRFGTLSLAEALEPAIAFAKGGVPIDLDLRDFFSGDCYGELAAAFPLLEKVYSPVGPPRLGDRLFQDSLAVTLGRLSSEGARSLYGGAIGRDLIEDLGRAGALLSLDDLAAHRSRFDTSLSVEFRGARIHVAPPNSQGLALAALVSLWELYRDRHDHAGFDPEAYLHIKKLAFGLRDRHVADPARAGNAASHLGQDALRALLGTSPSGGGKRGGGGDTSTLVVMDRNGNAVSWVQSLFEEFGSGVISPSTGIVMHNRLCLEQLDDDPVRGLQPGMRPFHTLCPALVIRDGSCEMAIATPGDHGQPQSIFQVLLNRYDEALNIQEAIEAPRLRHDVDPIVMLEERAPASWSQAIARSGYAVRQVGPWSRLMGGVTAICRSADGLLLAGADPRRACYAASA